MRVLGVDPGVAKIGWGIVDGEELIDFGVWQIKSNSKQMQSKIIEEQTRLSRILLDVVKENNVTHLAVERVPGRLMGERDRVFSTQQTCLVIAGLLGLAYQQIGSREVKKLVTLNDRASKSDVAAAVRMRFSEMPDLEGMPWDAYDGVAIASAAIGRPSRWWNFERAIDGRVS